MIELIMSLNKERYSPIFGALQDTEFFKHADVPCPKIVFGIESISKPGALLKMIYMAYFIYRSKIDLVHIFFNDSAIIAPLFCKIGGARVITSRRDMGFWYTLSILKLLKFSNLFVDRIAVNSRAVKENVNRCEGFPRSRIDVLYNGLSPDRFNSAASPDFRQDLGIGPEDRVIGMVSNLYPVKRPRDLIRALSFIHESDRSVHLVFVGGGAAEINPLRLFVRDLGLHGKVHFLGRKHDVGSIIKHFDVCVLCSESEGLSNAILEYMCCSKPVVCTSVGGNPELIEDGFNGFLVPAGDVDQLTDRIEKLLANKVMRDEMGENGRKRFMSEFTGDKMASAYMNLYDRTLNNSETHRT